jgi:hypothetical protein
MRERRLWMVKTDIEYATLYAALLLRLRNPREEDFKLTWRLQDGDCAALHAPLTARPAAAPSPAEAAGGAGADNAPPAADGKADIASPIKSQGAGPSAAEERSEIAAAIEIDNEADIQRYRESERITND